MRFALVETGGTRQGDEMEAALELVLPTGGRVRIGAGVDSTALRGAGGVARMIHLPASVCVYLCLTACDMRKSFDGLHQLVRDRLERDAFDGHLFVLSSPADSAGQSHP